MSTFETVQQLSRALNSSTQEMQRGAPALDKPDGMRGSIVSLLAHLVPEATTVHVEVQFTDRESPSGAVQLIAFTEDRVVVVTRSGDGTPVAESTSRRGLRTIRVLQAPNLAMGGYGDGTLLQIELDYGDALSAPIRLGHGAQTGNNALELNEFVPRLLEDLNHG